MVNALLARSSRAVDWISAGYRPSPRALAIVRVCFALYVLIWPINIAWIGEMPAVAFNPPPGPFALAPGPASAGIVSALAVIRAIGALWVLIGFSTRIASTLLTVVLVVCSGLAYSFGKVDHQILYELAPLMLGLAGWGSAWSVDALRRRAAPVSGYAMFIYGTVIAFALFTAAAVKAASGWLSPARQATRFFIESSTHSERQGLLTIWILHFDSTLFWKCFDYATLFAEGWLVVAVFFPGLFRIGLLMLTLFHIGVWLLMGINFSLMTFVYIGFFLRPLSQWFPEIALLRDLKSRRPPKSESWNPVAGTAT